MIPTAFQPVKVLDYGYVFYIDHMGSDESICQAARISFRNQNAEKTHEEDQKLINYLYRNRHTSPFEMGKIQFQVKMPIFVARQYVRHRMQNMNEVSARYKELPNEFYIPTVWRKNLDKGQNKQQSAESDDLNHRQLYHTVENFCATAYVMYKSLLDIGVAREMARMVLPTNIYTEMVVCWDMNNLIKYIQLREDPHAQQEHQEYGKAFKFIASKIFPKTFKAVERYKVRVEDTELRPSSPA